MRKHRYGLRERDKVQADLENSGVRPSKGRGQNFLKDEEVLRKIVEFGEPRATETILEIGPGLGALTAHLQLAARLILVEIEGSFCDNLRVEYPTAEVIERDFCETDLGNFGNGLTVFGNVPYSSSSNIVIHLIESRKYLKRAVLMFQREFADRLVAKCACRDYGRLSVLCQLFCDTRSGPIIDGDAFVPPTKVQSRVVELTFLDEPRFNVSNLDFFEHFVKSAFHMRRKKLRNSLIGSGLFKSEDLKALEVLNTISLDRRAETLSVEEFVNLSESAYILKHKVLAS